MFVATVAEVLNSCISTLGTLTLFQPITCTPAKITIHVCLCHSGTSSPLSHSPMPFKSSALRHAAAASSLLAGNHVSPLCYPTEDDTRLIVSLFHSL